MANSLKFWSEIRKRRNHIGLAVLGWIPFALLFSGLLSALRVPTAISGVLALPAWLLFCAFLWGSALSPLPSPGCFTSVLLHEEGAMQKLRHGSKRRGRSSRHRQLRGCAPSCLTLNDRRKKEDA
jgi:hypothetical protein